MGKYIQEHVFSDVQYYSTSIKYLFYLTIFKPGYHTSTTTVFTSDTYNVSVLNRVSQSKA